MKREVVRGRTVIEVHAALEEVLAAPPSPDIVGVDIPIGFLGVARRAGRVCDQMARAVLGWPRAASVFSPPVRSALAAATYAAGLRANRASSADRVGISRQVFGLFPKMREADALMTPRLQRRVFEVHPELSFREMNRGRALPPKRSAQGQRLRRRLLSKHGFSAPATTRRLPSGVGLDDVLDAYAVCWSATRIARGVAERIPTNVQRDARGLRLEIWW